MFDSFKEAVEKRLADILKPIDSEYSVLINAMNYSACAGGKRLRPVLLMAFCELCGGNPFDAVDFAAALEMIHTYSLIHDDLPCMDNDDMRRGRPSCHIKFGEADALLAGDALLTDAFGVALNTQNIEPSRIISAASVLSKCAGSRGMIGGQVIDLKYEGSEIPLDSIKEMYHLKTGKLLVAASRIGCILGGGSEEDVDSASKFAENLGLAFQIRDDILDITGNEAILGKPTGSDGKSNKSTYVSHVGLDAAENDVKKFTNNALNALNRFGKKAETLKKYALALCERNS